MKTQMEEIANLVKKAQESRAEYKAKREAVLVEDLSYDEFLAKTRNLMCEELGTYQYFIQAIANWSEFAIAEA